MAGLCEGGNDPPGSLKASNRREGKGREGKRGGMITVHLTAESRPNNHSVECAPCIMAADLDIKRQRICLTWSQAIKGNIEGGEFDPVLWIEFGVAQWSERLVDRKRRTLVWPPRSTDLTPIDLPLELVYQRGTVYTLEKLRQ
ncbi:hypothetical protein ANN_22437 [Periplaneta americana]|uniref:Uncharacterized protein n=1 Tax=Periplaneta americana TaxID=6978 RepID=A0ABQ8S8A5_PERAM|nr:hypothetical protein ANN_22437 [Periplaneta americana]